MMDSQSNGTHYKLMTKLDDVSMKECYLKVGEGLDNKTEYVYSDDLSAAVGGIGALVTGMAGFTLNTLVIIALVKTPNLRKDYITPFIISLALTDLLFSTIALPAKAATYFVR